MTDSKNSFERCVLCLDQKRSPVRIQCGHSFCCDCLDVYKSYNKFAWANKCPICRNELNEKKRAHWFICLLILTMGIVLCICSTVIIYSFINSTKRIYHY